MTTITQKKGGYYRCLSVLICEEKIRLEIEGTETNDYIGMSLGIHEAIELRDALSRLIKEFP